MINRAAMIVTPKQPYIDWAAGLDDSGLAPSEDDEKSVYLIPEEAMEDRQEQILKQLFAEVFERELEAWHTDPTAWPEGRTLRMFKEWFKIEFHSVVIDLGSEALVDDET